VSISCNSVIVEFPILNDVELIELHVCEQEITQEISEEEKRHHCGNIFPSDREELYLCGEVSGVRDIDVFLGIYLHKDGFEKLIFHNTIDDRFPNGFFCRTILLLDNENRVGSYKIEFLYRRKILDSIEFELR
jgi:hypothetical protein